MVIPSKKRTLFVMVSVFFYSIFFGITLQYGTEILRFDLPQYAFYITQANYCACFAIVLSIAVATKQSFLSRLAIVFLLVNLLAALSYTIAYLLFAHGDWASLWRLIEIYGRFFPLFILANLVSHLIA
jgi:hypothetical protein